jgi:hypothetical protein
MSALTTTTYLGSGRMARIDHRDAAEAGLLLITREWAILAGENHHTTGTFRQITGRPPRPVAEFLHHHRVEFA